MTAEEASLGHPDSFPTSINPMLATLVAKPFSDSKWLFEPKLDGFRILVLIRNGENHPRSLYDSSVDPEPSNTKEGAVSVRWGLYAASFILGVAIFVMGLGLDNTPLTFAGLIIVAIGFFSRRIVKRSISGPKGHTGEGEDDQRPT